MLLLPHLPALGSVLGYCAAMPTDLYVNILVSNDVLAMFSAVMKDAICPFRKG